MTDTICAIATASGGALGIVRVSGPQAIAATSAIFSRSILNAEANTIHFRTVRDAQRQVVDEVLVSLFRAPHSYTGEDSTEISCHGSAYILQRVVQLLIDNGCRLAEPGEYTQRAFLNGKMDLSQAEAVADLIAARNAVTHRIALSQMRGGYSHKLHQLRDSLVEMTSLMELELDFSEEDVRFADRTQLLQLADSIAVELQHLTASFSQGNALRNGIPVAIVGAPNVGKSTLLNALLEDDRAIVSDIQGTTRDLVEDTMQIEGITFRFIDTAGIRHTADRLERMGIERSIQAARDARIVIMLTEPGVPYPDVPITDGQTVLRIVNKTPQFQALTGVGLDGLRSQLLAAARPTDAIDVVVTNVRHYQSFTLALQDIQRVRAALSTATPTDLISEDLRQCLHHLGAVLGTVTPDDVLHTIFSRFCIGK